MSARATGSASTSPLEEQGREDFLANGPIRLSALYVEQSNLSVSLKPGTVLFDDVHVTMSDGLQVLLDGFDSIDAWSLLKTTENSISDELKSSSEVFENVPRRGGVHVGEGRAADAAWHLRRR